MDQDALLREGLTVRIEKAVPRWRGRPDSEHEQAVIRLIVGIVAATYILSAIVGQGRNIFAESTFYVILAFFLSAGFIILWLFIDPTLSIPRRLLGAVTDITASTMALYLNGNLAAPLFIVYLWVIFGNGFRFGKSYLYFSMVLSVIGYGWVIVFSPYWHVSPQVTYGLLAGLIVLPMYVAALLGRLTRVLERLARANNAKSTFLAVMSHEIRTPLSGILGVISLFRNTALNEKQNHYLQLIEKSSDWLHRVISDGLDFSKVEADELIIEISPFSLQQVVSDLAALYQEVAEAKGIRFRSQIDPKLPACIAGDKAKLTQVLNNLLANACKFTENGEVSLQVDLAAADEACATVIFTVSDTGVGLTEEEAAYIFMPFRQADASTARKFGGTGLGLTIADRVVRMMGGVITVDSEKDNGAVFQFSLTFPRAVFLNSAESTEDSGGSPPRWSRPPRVLLVEDHEVNQEVIQQLLEIAGCEVKVAADGLRAIEFAGDSAWDLVFMDCQMPVVDGYEATRQIRSVASSRNKDVPIVALTAHVTVADRNRCLAAGMSDYLGKPCSLAEILTMLKKWLPALLTGLPTVAGEVRLGETTGADETVAPSDHDARRRQEIHDLRNFITKIIGSAELALLKFDSPEEVRKYLEIILRETRKESARLRNSR